MRKRNKIVIIVGLFLIIVAILLLLRFIYNKRVDRQKTDTIIENLFNMKDDISQIEDSIEPIQLEYPSQEVIEEYVLQDNYLGYIEISSRGIKRLITFGTSDYVLNKGLVGMLNISAKLDDPFGNIILAGHSISNVFQNLHFAKIGDTIKIVSYSATYNYKVIGKYTIEDDDLSYFKKVENKKILTLVTCKKNNHQRLIIVAELCT